MGWIVLAAIVIGGSILALAQYGRGYRRATSLLIVGALVGVAAGHTLWPLIAR